MVLPYVSSVHSNGAKVNTTREKTARELLSSLVATMADRPEKAKKGNSVF